MAIVLQVLGIILLAIVAAVGVALLILAWKVRSGIGKLKRFAEEMTHAAPPVAPPRIHLVSLEGEAWTDPAEVDRLADPLPALGFDPVGVYAVEEMAGLTVAAWVHPERRVTAVVYEHPQAGVWLDLVTRYRDGRRLTYANTKTGSGVDHAPGHIVERYPGLGTVELFHRHVAQRDDGEFEPVSAVAFVERFEHAYADEMDWRNARGGTSIEEIRAIAEAMGQSCDESVLTAVRTVEARRAAEALNETLLERFLAESSLSAGEWERLRERVVVIHDRTTEDMVLEIFAESDDEGMDEPTLLDFSELTPRIAFARRNQLLPEAKQYRKIGTVQGPVEADVYAGPA